MADELPTEHLLKSLSPGARKIVAEVLKRSGEGHPRQGDWLSVIYERHKPMVEGMLTEEHREGLAKTLKAPDAGGEQVAVDEIARLAIDHATERGAERVSERDIVAVVLKRAGYELVVRNLQRERSFVGGTGAGGSVLDQYCRDLTREAAEGRIGTMLGRDAEIDEVIRVLCRPSKRNPILIGAAGVGKTAIVEGLAARIAADQVPEMLRGVRLIAVQPSVLLAGLSYTGQPEERVKKLIDEASRPDVVMFIDEAHTVVGAGGRVGTGDLANMLKPALARGEIACIAATTDEEYRLHIQPDGALERRFQPLTIQELAPETALEIARARAVSAGGARGVTFDDAALRWLVAFGADFMRNRRFPDKAVDLVDQCIGYAVGCGLSSVGIEDAQKVARSMVGMPVTSEERIETFTRGIEDLALLSPDATEGLARRLSLSMRGLDMRPARPNGIVLLLGPSAASAGLLAAEAARGLFGSPDRVVVVDFARYDRAEHVTMLIGAPAAYVGYGDRLPLHGLQATPWSVVLCTNIEAAHPTILRILTETLDSGFLTDAQGRRTYLSDALVILTAPGIGSSTRHGFGFTPGAGGSEQEHAARMAAGVLGQDIVELCDVVSFGASREESTREWVATRFLPMVAERYARQGLNLRWDDSVVEWFATRADEADSNRDWERMAEEGLGPSLAVHIEGGMAGEPQPLLLTVRRDGLSVERE